MSSRAKSARSQSRAVITTVLIANRGAIARRIVRACNELGLVSVVVFSPADAGAPYLEEASQTYPLTGHRCRHGIHRPRPSVVRAYG